MLALVWVGIGLGVVTLATLLVLAFQESNRVIARGLELVDIERTK